MTTRKSIPAKLAPTQSGWPETVEPSQPKAWPARSAASQTTGIEVTASRNAASARTPNAATPSTRRPIPA